MNLLILVSLHSTGICITLVFDIFAKNKTDVIVTFLALLELVKQQTVVLVQDKVFEDIVVKKVEEN